ncbi:MAG: peptidase family protein, partial [Candidatus Saccharibacteria bacterium]|nr:peptidase family protein [Candidatus Saccharibacteria bacterium]
MVIALAVIAVLVVIYFRHPQRKVHTIKKIEAPPQTTTLPPKTTFRGLPIKLKIPAISVDATLEYLGKTTNGDMTAPVNVDYAGWYRYGPLPGDEGTSVMAGHVVGLRGQAGVFNNLDKLKPGDALQVIDGKGKVASFTVRISKTYAE